MHWTFLQNRPNTDTQEIVHSLRHRYSAEMSRQRRQVARISTMSMNTNISLISPSFPLSTAGNRMQQNPSKLKTVTSHSSQQLPIRSINYEIKSETKHHSAPLHITPRLITTTNTSHFLQGIGFHTLRLSKCS